MIIRKGQFNEFEFMDLDYCEFDTSKFDKYIEETIKEAKKQKCDYAKAIRESGKSGSTYFFNCR